MSAIPDEYFLHYFNLLPQFGPKRLLILGNFFASFREAFKANPKQLAKAGLPAAVIKAFLWHRKSLDQAAVVSELDNNGIKILSYRDSNYPKLLLEVRLFPPLLYYRGRMQDAEELALAVVGTRKITPYGKSVVPQLLEPLCRNGITIVSGLAYGIDAVAHEVAINLGKRTIAVLGGGLDDNSLYPQKHVWLANEILKHGGALLSEHPPGAASLKQNFVARNRIISGISAATIVVECSLKSGALITAQHAMNQNRKVYAVPGPLYSQQSRGPNNLLKSGGRCLTTAEDIFDDFNIKASPGLSANILPLTSDEQKLLKLLDVEPKTLDEIIKTSGLEASLVTATLTFLEMKGRIKNLGAQQYSKVR